MYPGNALEGDAILGDALKSVLPYERDVAGVGCLKPPGQEGGGAIASHCAHIVSTHCSVAMADGVGDDGRGVRINRCG